jgi:hypothetical protein
MTPKPAALAHMAIHQLSEWTVDAGAQAFDAVGPLDTLDHQIETQELHILVVQLENIEINIAGNIALDPYVVVSCHVPPPEKRSF